MTKLFAGFLTVLLLAGAGCTPDAPDAPDDSAETYGTCFMETPWGGCVDIYGIDDMLVDTWTLQAQTLVTPAGQVLNPFSGRTLTFSVENFTFDDTPEPTVVPDLVYVENWASEQTASGTCTASGTSAGSWKAAGAINLDLDDGDPTTPVPVVYTIEIDTDPANPTVTCESGGASTSANTATSPLGTGPGATPTSPTTARVEYVYSISDSGNMLTLSSATGSVTTSFVFTR